MTEAQAQRLGQLIVKTREKRGLSTRQLVRLAEIPQTWLQRLEHGHFLQPSPDRLARLAEVLEIDPVHIDRLTRNYLADSLPSVHTYFRSKEKASPEEIREIEAAIRRIHKKYEGREQP